MELNGCQAKNHGTFLVAIILLELWEVHCCLLLPKYFFLLWLVTSYQQGRARSPKRCYFCGTICCHRNHAGWPISSSSFTFFSGSGRVILCATHMQCGPGLNHAFDTAVTWRVC